MEPPKIGEGVSGLSVGSVQAFFSAAGAAGAAPSLARTTTERTRLGVATRLRLLLRTAVAVLFWRSAISLPAAVLAVDSIRMGAGQGRYCQTGGS